MKALHDCGGDILFKTEAFSLFGDRDMVIFIKHVLHFLGVTTGNL